MHDAVVLPASRNQARRPFASLIMQRSALLRTEYITPGDKDSS